MIREEIIQRINEIIGESSVSIQISSNTKIVNQIFKQESKINLKDQSNGISPKKVIGEVQIKEKIISHIPPKFLYLIHGIMNHIKNGF